MNERGGEKVWSYMLDTKLDMESQSDSQNVQNVKQMKIPTTTAEQRVSDNETAIADTEHN